MVLEQKQTCRSAELIREPDKTPCNYNSNTSGHKCTGLFIPNQRLSS